MSRFTRAQGNQSLRGTAQGVAGAQAKAAASSGWLHPAVRLQRTIGNQAVLRLKDDGKAAPRQLSVASQSLKLLQRKEDAPEKGDTKSLKTQRIGVVGDEQPLALPREEELTDDWGADEMDFGGDKKVDEFIGRVLERVAQRKTEGDPKVAESLGSKQVLADEYRRMAKYMKAHAKGKAKAGSVQTRKWNWLSAMPSRIDAATTEQKGINFKWAFTPYSIPAPTEEEWRSVPEGIQDTGSFHKISDAMEAFLSELKKLADKEGYQFKVENRENHGQGHSVDMYLLDSKGKTDTDLDQGFWNPDKASGFLKLFGDAAKAAKVRWHVIYNDPRVGKEVNIFYRDQERKEGHKGDVHARVNYGGSYRLTKDKKGIEENYHGPSPLKLHFHLDVVW